MGSTNRATLGYVAEVTKGTTPATPAFTAARHTSDGIVATPTRQASDEIRSDRQITDRILVDQGVAGSVGVELSFNGHDTLLEAALQGTWSSNASRDNLGIADSVITNVATTGTIVTVTTGAVFPVNSLVYFSGFGVANNNGLFKTTTQSATVPAFVGSGITDEAVPPGTARMVVVGFVGASADITATASGLASTALDFTALGISDGEWLKVGGDGAGNAFATAANNSWARVAKNGVAAHAVTFDVLPTGWSVDAGTGKTIQVFTGDFLTTGTTQRSFTFERQQQDLTSPTYELLVGCEIDEAALSFKSASKITGSFNVTGRTGPAGTTARTAGATDVAAPTYPVLNAASNVGRLMEGGAVTAVLFEEIGFDLKNNLGRETAVGTLGAANLRDGEIDLTGTLSAYFSDLTLLNKVLNDTPTSLMWRTGRSDGVRESMVFDVPQAKLLGTAPVSGKNASRMFSGSYEAYRHPTLGYTASVSRYWYLPVAV